MPEIARILETGLIWFLDSRQSLWTSCSVLSAGICTIFGSERYTKGNVLPLYEGQSCFPPLCGSKPPMSNRISRSSAASSIPSFCLSTVGAASAPLQGRALRNKTSRLTGSLCCRFAFPPSGAIVGGRFPRCGMIVCSLRRPGAAPDEECPNAADLHRNRSPWSGSHRRCGSACSPPPRQPACP